MRKFWIGLVSLGVLSVIYLLYQKIGATGKIDLSTPQGFTYDHADSNLAPAGPPVAGIGDPGIDAQVARFVHTDKNNRIDRVFGFRELLHRQGDQWELAKPYVTLYQRSFRCDITADNGQIRVEKTGSGLSPTEGRLAGNVVIHISPRRTGGAKESFLYLDDLTFVSERSQFTTPGPLRFVSPDAVMVGTGLEGAYNSEASRLEYLRITDLESLRLKASKAGLFGGATSKPAKLAEPGPAPDKQAPMSVTSAGSKKPVPSARTTTQKTPQEQGQYYRCLFSRDVVIDTPEQLVLAQDEISISNIFWKGGSVEDTNSAAEPEGAAPAGATPTPAGAPALPAVAGSPDKSMAPPAPEDFDVVVTCRNGILAVPMGSSRSLQDFPASPDQPPKTGRPAAGDFAERAGRTLLIAKRIDHDASAGSTVAAGPVELVFDVNDPTGRQPDAPPVPVKVTAKKTARFLPDSNQVIFEGGAVCTMVSSDPNGTQQHTLAAPTITVDLAAPGTASSDDLAADMRRLIADGDSVSLSSIRKADEKVLSGVELKCRQFEYDTPSRMFTATGPGEIKVDNSNAPEPNKPGKKFSFHRRCYALVRNFAALRYYMDANRIVADAASDALLDIGYVPVIDANYGQAVKAGAGHIEAFFDETMAGGLELSTLSATGTITYDDGEKQFQGNRLFYDAEESLVTVLGAPGRPCQFNGTPVDAIQWDPNSNHLSFEIPAPGTLPLE
ncbi:MAG TPA: hypothetical protein VMX13_07350 [Sedimentisphaerales bacterium]|nr:hypothetical protein [Sedimentisphaerales bacterium]